MDPISIFLGGLFAKGGSMLMEELASVFKGSGATEKTDAETGPLFPPVHPNLAAEINGLLDSVVERMSSRSELPSWYLPPGFFASSPWRVWAATGGGVWFLGNFQLAPDGRAFWETESLVLLGAWQYLPPGTVELRFLEPGGEPPVLALTCHLVALDDFRSPSDTATFGVRHNAAPLMVQVWQRDWS